MIQQNPKTGNRYMIFLILYVTILSYFFYKTNFLNHLKILPPLLHPLTHIIIFVIPFFIYLLVTGQKFNAVIRLKKLDTVNVIYIVLMCFCAQPILMLVSLITSFFFENDVSTLMTEYSQYPLLLTILCIALTPAISEEITLRGIILSNYKDVSIKKAAIINGLFFGIIHFNLQQFFYAFAMGIIFAYFVHYTKSILASMLGHFVINASQFLLSYSVANSVDAELAANTVLTFSEKISVVAFSSVLAAIFLPAFIILFITFIKYNKHKNIKEYLFSEDDILPLPVYSPEPASVLNWELIVVILLFVLVG